MDNITYGIAQVAFEKAIKSGRLNKDNVSEYYAGNWMYMGHRDGQDEFKNIFTRKYLRSLPVRDIRCARCGCVIFEGMEHCAACLEFLDEQAAAEEAAREEVGEALDRFHRD